MASSSSNITAVHFSLIFFVMLSIILGVVAYMSYDDARNLRASAAKNDTEARKMKGERDKNAERARTFAARVGFQQPLGDSATQPGTANNALQSYKRDVGDESKTLKALLDEAQLQIKREKATFDANKQRLDAQVADLDKKLKASEDLADDLTKQKNDAEARVKQIDKDKNEAIAAKQGEIDKLSAERGQLKAQIDDLNNAHQEAIAKLDKKISDLQSTVALKQQQIDQLQKVSFEKPDGRIRWVDHGTRLVWIDLGSADKLPERLTLSVYSKAHHGIARGKQDIKGSIEITRIVGAHMAEARILKNSLEDPIRKDDPIYTPLWSPGTTESFAFSGEFDLDGDGSSDRELLHRIVRAAGAKISNEVDDNGVRHGTGLSHDDKFLVIGSIPDPAGAAPNSAERKRREQMAAAHKRIQDEAKNKGVRIIRKADFMAWIGFKSDRRLWRPGEATKRKLRAGAHSTTVDEYVGKRGSSGQTSGIYTKRGRARGQRSSSGQTSKIFGRK